MHQANIRQGSFSGCKISGIGTTRLPECLFLFKLVVQTFASFISCAETLCGAMLQEWCVF